MEIILTESEMRMAALIGAERNIESLKRNRKQTHGRGLSPAWSDHIEGAAGEIAVARVISRYWPGSVNSFKDADISNNIQVRTRSNDSYDLIVRNDDNSNHIYVLVVGQVPNLNVIGWITGFEAKQNKWIQTYGNRPAAYFVPQSALYTDFWDLE